MIPLTFIAETKNFLDYLNTITDFSEEKIPDLQISNYPTFEQICFSIETILENVSQPDFKIENIQTDQNMLSDIKLILEEITIFKQYLENGLIFHKYCYTQLNSIYDKIKAEQLGFHKRIVTESSKILNTESVTSLLKDLQNEQFIVIQLKRDLYDKFKSLFQPDHYKEYPIILSDFQKEKKGSSYLKSVSKNKDKFISDQPPKRERKTKKKE